MKIATTDPLHVDPAIAAPVRTERRLAVSGRLVLPVVGTLVVLAGQIAEDLVDANLVAQPTPGRYRLHDLLREHAAAVAERTEPESERRAAVGRVLDYYLGATAGPRP